MQFDLPTRRLEGARLCKDHAEYFYSWLEGEKTQYKEEENKLWIIAVALLVGVIIGSFFIPSEILNTQGFRFLLLSIIYIIGFSTPYIYNRILRLPGLKDSSFTHLVKTGLEPRDIIQINATVVTGALILLTLLSQQGQSTSPTLARHLSTWMGVDSNVLIADMTGTTVIIFGFSAIAVSIIKDIEVGRRLMVAGFVYLFFAILTLTYL